MLLKLNKVSSLIEAGKDILIAWMVLMSIWGMFAGIWAYNALKRSDIRIDYMTGTFTVSEERPLLVKERGR
jgi:hypothetical protein